MQHAIFFCGLCGSFHPWNWSGSCKDGAIPDLTDFARKVGDTDLILKTWADRIAALAYEAREKCHPMASDTS